jgi:hypothetical protein
VHSDTDDDRRPAETGLLGSEVGIEEFGKNLLGISLEFHENFEETACISDVYCIQ